MICLIRSERFALHPRSLSLSLTFYLSIHLSGKNTSHHRKQNRIEKEQSTISIEN